MSTSRDQGIGRREFLTTSACVLATAAVGPDLLAGLAGAPRLIATGFAPLGIASSGNDAFERNVIAAERIPAADFAFLRHGASVSVAGLSGADARSCRAIDFLVHYAYRDGGEQRFAPFYAWAGHRGSPVRFTVPVDEHQRIRFSVTAPMPAAATPAATTRRAFARTETAQSTVPTALPVELGLDGGLRLTRGLYVIVPVYDGQAAPSWSQYSLRKDGSRWALHTDVLGAVRPVEFEHFVVRVDHGSPRTPRVRKA